MDLIIARTLALFVVAILVAIAARRLHLPYTVGLVVAGMTLAFSHINLGINLTHDIIFDLILPPLLFEGALNLDCRRLLDDWVPILTLSILGVMISAAVVVAGLSVFLSWPLASALVFGVLIAATDPVSVIALFKDLGITGRLRLIIESESLFNDGVAAVLFSLALAFAGNGLPGPVDAARELAALAGGGIATGAVVGVLALFVAGRTRDALVEAAVTVVAAYGAFLLAQSLHFSGVLAAVAAGLLMGTLGLKDGTSRLGLSPQSRAFMLELWEFLAFIANSIIFLLIGIAVSHLRFGVLGAATLAAVIVLVLLGRAATVYPLSFLFRRGRRRISLPEQHLLWWSGLRGALALGLALSLPLSLPMRDAILIATFATVVFSVVAQGVTMPFLLRRMGYDGKKHAS